MNRRLLQDRRFWPLFWTQFLGAFNDNLFKNALVMLIAFRGLEVFGLPPAQMIALTGAIFIVPFFLFSATAGQLADTLDKARMMRWTKVAEIVIMSAGALGFLFGSVEVLLLVLFGMGFQSTVFGPCKYSVLPQHLTDDEIVAGNALVETATYLAILLGTIAGGVLILMDGGQYLVAGGVVGVAVLGALMARWIPPAPALNAGLTVQWNPITPTIEIVGIVRKNRTVLLSVLGISWFWLYGAAFLTLFPVYAKDLLHGNEQVATLFLALFSVGIGLGSMLCEKLSRERLELGLVPIGAFGMSFFTLDLWLIGEPWAAGPEAYGPMWLVSSLLGWRIMGDMTLLAMFGGFLIVPLYTLIQLRAEPAERSRIIAGNNIINAFFMVGSSLMLMAMQALEFSIPTIFALFALMNAVVAVYIFSVVPEFMLRFFVWMLSNVLYRVRAEGLQNIPREGPAVLVCNHVSFVDWLIIVGAVKRPARYIMDQMYFDMPIANYLFRAGKAIPITSKKIDPESPQRAMDQVSRELREGWLVCIFPEGQITKDGEFTPFRAGIERIIARDPVPVVPMALNGMWGSFFSRVEGKAMRKPFRRWWSRVWLTVEAPIPAEDVSAEKLQKTVHDIWARRPDQP